MPMKDNQLVIPKDGFKASFHCDKGLKLVGHMQLTCTSPGNWDHQPPKCCEFNELVCNRWPQVLWEL